jgi:hypothetical protein
MKSAHGRAPSVTRARSAPTALRRDQRSQEGIRDDASIARLRAFEIFYSHRKEALARDSERRWEEQERVRQWQAEQARARLFRPTKRKDDGLIEGIVLKRNDERRTITGDKRRIGCGMIGRPPLPREDRAVYADPGEHLFYWGA